MSKHDEENPKKNKKKKNNNFQTLRTATCVSRSKTSIFLPSHTLLHKSIFDLCEFDLCEAFAERIIRINRDIGVQQIVRSHYTLSFYMYVLPLKVGEELALALGLKV